MFIIGGILVLFICIYIYITRLTSNEIFPPANKIHREMGRAKDLSATLYEDIVPVIV
jgi:NADH:ubiquinone oxidoreductase subunit 6 (subunit J)